MDGMDAPKPGISQTYCPHCGHLYPSDTVECPRCPMATDHAKGGKCPACAKPLVPEKMGDVTVDRCAACGGVWFDRGEVVRVLDMHTQGASGVKLGELERRFPSYRSPREHHGAHACVRCRTRMHRRLAAPRSGVLVDLCGPHGIWFERGEFERFQEFVRAGGLEVARAREEAHATAAHAPASHTHPHVTPVYLHPGWPRQSHTLLEVIEHAIGPLPQPRYWGMQTSKPVP